MDVSEAQDAILSLLGRVSPRALPNVIQWMKTSSEIEMLTTSNSDVLLHNIADDLRNSLPVDAMVVSENLAIENIHRRQRPTLHVDAFLYDDEAIDSLCEEGKMSRNYCTSCGSTKTAPLAPYSGPQNMDPNTDENTLIWEQYKQNFLSHSFSIMELKFLFHNAIPDLSGKTLLDVGSRLGAVLYAGYVYSSASKLEGVEINAEFCNLQEKIINKYNFSDRIQYHPCLDGSGKKGIQWGLNSFIGRSLLPVHHSDICSQKSLLHQADVVVLNNVFEYFMVEEEQIKAWMFIYEMVRKKGCLVVTVPSLQQSFSKLQLNLQLNEWVEETELDTGIFLGPDTDQEALSDIHLYRVL